MKRLQNKIAEGGMTLVLTAAFALLVWLACGLVENRLWPQLACFAATVAVLVEMSNECALLRVRSRMVSSSFIMLSTMACFLFPMLKTQAVALCFVMSFLLLTQTYQDRQSVGRAFYAFAAVGLASLIYVHVLWYVPVLWVLMGTQFHSLSWRTWFSSVLGLLTPYWFAVLWLLVPIGAKSGWTADLLPLGLHFAELARIDMPDWRLPLLVNDLPRLLAYTFTLIISLVAIGHFHNYSFEDKIRIRQLYGFFTALTLLTLLFVLLQPQHYDILMPLLFVSTSPLVAHVLTLSNSRLSNILFFVALVMAVTIAAYSLVSHFPLPFMAH